MSLSFTFEVTSFYAGLMHNRGAPPFSLRLPKTTIDANCVAASKHASRKPILSATQLQSFGKFLKGFAQGADWMVIGTPSDEDLAMGAAVGLMLRATMLCTENQARYCLPFMWPLYGGARDKLRDFEEFRNGVGRIGMLLLTNLAENSTREKLEKARDLLHMYSSTPRVLVVSGADPLAFALDQLHATPSSVLHIVRGAKQRNIQV